jgi:hypothetical protein
MRTKATVLVILMALSVLVAVAPHAVATLYVDWVLDTTKSGELITAFAHLYGVPQVEDTYGFYFCHVTLDASAGTTITGGIIEVSVGEYAQPARKEFEIYERKVYDYWLSPTFNEKIAQVSSPTPVTVDLKITDKKGNQLYADSKTIQMLPINYYAWVLGGHDQTKYSVVLATPHADPIQKVLRAAAPATPWNDIVGYQEREGYNHTYIVKAQMRAVYNVLKNLGITYVSTDVTFSSTIAQRVKLPMQTLSDNSGNCIETTLLFDSIFEAIGFETELVMPPTHAYLAVITWPGSGEVIPLETTMLATSTFDKASEKGGEEFQKDQQDPEVIRFHVWEVRQTGIAPTPYMDKMPDSTEFYQKLDAVSAKITSARQTIEKLEAAIKEKGSISSDVQKLYSEALSLFDQGNYPDAEKCATDAMQELTSSPWSIFPTNLPGGASFAMPQQNFLLIGIAAVVFAVVVVAVALRKR